MSMFAILLPVYYFNIILFFRDAPCVVVNVEYRCGPEHKYPANHEDAVCVVRWVKMNKGLIGTIGVK